MVLAGLQRQAELPESFGPPWAFTCSSGAGDTVKVLCAASVLSSETVAGRWVSFC